MKFPDGNFAACLFGLACLVFSAHSAAAVEGGVFCIRAGSYFVERPEPEGALTFDVLESNAQGNVVEINGVAVPHKGGWRYQVKSDNDPQQRCTLDITPVAGGFRMDTVEGARCSAMGGHNAETALMGALFPASSRVKGIAPAVGSAGKIPQFDCHSKKFDTAETVAPAKAANPPSSNDALGQWSVGVSEAKKHVNAHGKTTNGQTLFYIACFDHPQKVQASFGPYRGTALDNIDEATRPLVFEVKNRDGEAQKFPVNMHYYGPDQEWVLNDESILPPSFLDKFGPGGLLTILNGQGGKVLDVDLSGAGKAREMMRSVCRM